MLHKSNFDENLRVQIQHQYLKIKYIKKLIKNKINMIKMNNYKYYFNFLKKREGDQDRKNLKLTYIKKNDLRWQLRREDYYF